MGYKWVMVLCAVAACGPRNPGPPAAVAPAAAVTVQIDSAAMLRDIGVLAHDSMEGRLVGTPGGARARAHVERRFRAVGLQPLSGTSFLLPFEFTGRNATSTTQGVNIAGIVRGTTTPDRYIIVTAHYDHLGIREGQIFNGADDNASGTSALIALAANLAQNRPRHSIIFVAFDAEEGGLRGARHFVANLPVPKESILLNVNMDMIGRNDKGELYVAGTHHTPRLLPLVQRVIPTAEVTLIAGHDTPAVPRDDWTTQSDHGAFHAAGIPFLYFGVEDHPDYHRPTDDVDRIQPGFFARAARTVLAVVRTIDASLN